MGQQTNIISPLKKIAECIELLDNSSQQLLGMMDKQIEAIIASDAGRIEQLSDVHNSLSRRYKEYEKIFIHELTEALCTPGLKEPVEEVKLVNLKKVYPEAAEMVDQWLEVLSDKTSQLQKKHKQIMQLLEFAMQQNAKTMHSLYSMHNEKNSHYEANGSRSEVRTGVAVNQEI